MRIGVFALALTAFVQPAFAAHSHRHSHHIARTRHVDYAGHHHRFARVQRAPIESGYAMPQAFARTDAIETPFFGDDSFPNRSWNQNSNRNSWNQSWSSPGPAQQLSSLEPAPRPRSARMHDGALGAMIARHAAANGVPAELVHRVVIRESRYNARARNGSNLGLMQIKHATARSMGYAGSASGLLDAETNLTYAVRYLAGAYRAAGGSASRAVAYYASGYHGRGVRRAPAVQQAVAWSSPSWEMQSAPVFMRDTDAVTYQPRVRRHYRL